MKAMKRRLLIAFITLTVIALVSYQFIATESEYETLKGEIFSAQYQVIYEPNPSIKLSPLEIQSAIENELRRIDWIASSWKNESEINRYNQSINKEHFQLSEDLKFLITRSEEIKHLTQGAFNIEHEKEKLDLSGIAKGYAVDRIANYLTEELGIESFLVEIGGEIKASGTNTKGKNWNVGIFIPPGYESIRPPRVTLENNSIATSGCYFKGSHITNPESGKAVSNPLISVSVINPSNTTADALATALYVMGAEKGMLWARGHKVHAIFILEEGTIMDSSR